MVFKIASGKKKKVIHLICPTWGFIGINCRTSFFGDNLLAPQEKRGGGENSPPGGKCKLDKWHHSAFQLCFQRVSTQNVLWA
jgi:hypothetical protein